ncbi:MAG: SpoIIE family protein phosphatase [Bacteroidales bacterium]|nr:SpoIIE family protein phosphatase [Bacteroidales bacterium]
MSRTIKIFLLLLIAGSSNWLFAQNLDSLRTLIINKSDYNAKIEAFEELANYYSSEDQDSAEILIKQWIRLAEVHNDPLGIANAKVHYARFYSGRSEFEKAIEQFKLSKSIYLKQNDTIALSNTIKELAETYSSIKDQSNALKNFLEALELKESLNDEFGMASIYNSIGSIYYNNRKYKEAYAYFQKSLTISENREFYFAQAILLMNIGNIYNDSYTDSIFNDVAVLVKDSLDNGKLKTQADDSIDTSLILKYYRDEAISYYNKSLVVAKKLKNKNILSQLYLNLGIIDTIHSVEYFVQYYKIRNEMGDVHGQWTGLKNLAVFYNSRKNYHKANIYAKKALKLVEKGEYYREERNDSYVQLATIKNNLREYEDAYNLLKNHLDLKDSLQKDEQVKEFAAMEKRWNYEKREKENALLKKGNELLKKESELVEAKNAKQRIYLWASGLGLLLFGFLIFFILRGYRQKQKANLLLSEQKAQIEKANLELNHQNEEIAAQRDEIEAQRDVVFKQKEQIEEIHKEVSESIDYAKRLQTAILPKTDVLQANVSDYFVLFLPKDKVSGDFYWWTHLENKTIITAADCTGHGVPGAFMSMLGVSFLKEIVTKEYITQPALILKKLRKEIIKTLDQKGIAGEQKDGMDMSLISVDHQHKRIQFAGANNPLYIVSNSDISQQIIDAKPLNEDGEINLFEIKADKMPIAIYEKMDPFTNHELQLQSGDILYMFSDGFADQFGGPKGKKFMYKTFKKILLENSQLSMIEQKEKLHKAFTEWRGEEEQIDDVVVIGIKL